MATSGVHRLSSIGQAAMNDTSDAHEIDSEVLNTTTPLAHKHMLPAMPDSQAIGRRVI